MKYKPQNESEYATLEEYAYDSLGQLTQVDYKGDSKRHVYTYDLGGNLLTEQVYDIADADNPVLENTVSYTYGDEDWGDLLTAYNGDTITYDSIGNPLTYRDGISLTWQNGRQLQSLTQGDNTISYTYGSNGMRLSKTVNGTVYTYLYNGDQLIQETIGDKILDFSYDASGTVYAVRYKANASNTGNYYYYAHNTRGDVIALYDANGALYAKYTYDVWGNTVSVINSEGNKVPETSTNISIIQPFRYRGYCFDNETGLYYLQSRYYDPVTHRFLNADDEDNLGANNKITAFNLFSYCENNPVNYFDSDGNLSTLAKVAIGLGIITGLAIATAFTGGAAAAICGAALSGAVISGASGAVFGAVTGGITGGWSGALDSAATGFMTGTIIGGITGAASAGINIATGSTTVVGHAHGSRLHKFATNLEAGKMTVSGQYSQISLNRSLKTTGLNGGLLRPDVIGISKNGAHRLVEVVSPKQSIGTVSNKMASMLQKNPGSTGKVITWVRRLFK